MPRRFQFSSLIFLLAACCCWPATAQDRLLNEVYGQGVHTFHGGNYVAAARLLDDAINLGLNDPRAYSLIAPSPRCVWAIAAERKVTYEWAPNSK